MLSFAAAVFFLIITPGPGVLSTAGVGAAYGYAAGTRYVAGLFVGTNLVAIAVISGLAALVFSLRGLREVLLILSVIYLAYLAFRIAFSGVKIAFIESRSAPAFLHGVSLQLVNPKAYATNTVLFSGFAFMPDNLFSETLIKLIILNLIWVPIHFLWLAAGVTLHRLDLSHRTQFVINVIMGVSLMIVVGLAVLAQTGYLGSFS